MVPPYLRATATNIAMLFIGKPYAWGGDDPLIGFDCSGFVIEVLKSVGVLPRQGDWTANRLYHLFDKLNKGVRKEEVGEGCLVFWGRPAKVTHVEYAINKDLCIGASGGGSHTDSLEVAIRQNAYIKVRPWRTRPDLYGYMDPFKETTAI